MNRRDVLHVTKELLLNNEREAKQLAEKYDEADFGALSIIEPLFQDVEVLSANNAKLALFIAWESKKWAHTPAAKDINILKLGNFGVLERLLKNSSGWNRTAATQNFEILSLNDGFAAVALASQIKNVQKMFLHTWDQSEAAQRLDVLSLAQGRVAYNLAVNSELWAKSPAAQNPDVLKLHNGAVCNELARKPDWVGTEASLNIGNLNLPNQSSIFQAMIKTKPEVALNETFQDINLLLSDKTQDGFLQALMASPWSSTPAAFHPKVLSRMNLAYSRSDCRVFELNTPFKHANLLIAPVMYNPDIKGDLGSLIRYAISGASEHLTDNFIKELTVGDLFDCLQIIEKSLNDFRSLCDTERELLCTISIHLLLDRLNLNTNYLKERSASYAEKANVLMSNMTLEQLTFVNEIDCGAIKDVIAKHASGRVLGGKIVECNHVNKVPDKVLY